jgi:hypothetical protein
MRRDEDCIFPKDFGMMMGNAGIVCPPAITLASWEFLRARRAQRLAAKNDLEHSPEDCRCHRGA